MKIAAAAFPSLLLSLLCWAWLPAAAADDMACLQSMKQSMTDPSGVLSNWTFPAGASPCGFLGVTCDAAGGVSAIRLPASNLGGTFPMDALALCTALQILDLSANAFQGAIPTDACILMPTITSFNMSFNTLSAGLTSNITFCSHLQTLHLQHNQLSGILPWEIGVLPNLTAFDVSFNNFQGQIPTTFSNRSMVNQPAFPASSFAGNPGLCGAPLPVACLAH